MRYWRSRARDAQPRPSRTFANTGAAAPLLVMVPHSQSGRVLVLAISSRALGPNLRPHYHLMRWCASGSLEFSNAVGPGPQPTAAS